MYNPENEGIHNRSSLCDSRSPLSAGWSATEFEGKGREEKGRGRTAQKRYCSSEPASVQELKMKKTSPRVLANGNDSNHHKRKKRRFSLVSYMTDWWWMTHHGVSQLARSKEITEYYEKEIHRQEPTKLSREEIVQAITWIHFRCNAGTRKCPGVKKRRWEK